MSLSITGNILTAPFLRSDITSGEASYIGNHTYEIPGPSLNWINISGMIPVLSTATGLMRSCLGIVHTIYHLANAIFDEKNRGEHLEEGSLGVYNFVRGLLESVPIMGIFLVIILDVPRVVRARNEFDERLHKLLCRS